MACETETLAYQTSQNYTVMISTMLLLQQQQVAAATAVYNNLLTQFNAAQAAEAASLAALQACLNP